MAKSRSPYGCQQARWTLPPSVLCNTIVPQRNKFSAPKTLRTPRPNRRALRMPVRGAAPVRHIRSGGSTFRMYDRTLLLQPATPDHLRI